MANTLARPWLAVMLWLGAIAVALPFDAPLSRFLHAHASRAPDGHIRKGLVDRNGVGGILKFPGNFLFTLAVAAALLIFHPQRWKPAALVLLAGALSSANYLVKWIVGRPRPLSGSAYALEPFQGGFYGLLKQSNVSFPSGDVALAFATAATLAALFPRRWWLFYAVAAVVAAERVLENAHYLTDALGGAALGVLAAHLGLRLFPISESPTSTNGDTRDAEPVHRNGA